jgi:hypothetical protein
MDNSNAPPSLSSHIGALLQRSLRWPTRRKPEQALYVELHRRTPGLRQLSCPHGTVIDVCAALRPLIETTRCESSAGIGSNDPTQAVNPDDKPEVPEDHACLLIWCYFLIRNEVFR